MSTDYGLHCPHCNATYIEDGMREYMTHGILELRCELENLAIALLPLMGDIDRISACSLADDLPALLAFLIVHKTHPLTIIDEYGKEVYGR